MRAAPVTVLRVFTADNNDILDGTELEAAPGAGEYHVWAASTQNDTTVTVRRGGDTLISARAVPQRTNGMVLQSDDPPMAVMPVGSNDRLLIQVDIVTAATCQVIVQFVPY